MLSIAPAAKGKEYYGADNYYFDDGRSSTRWLGKGAMILGLKGEVSQDQYDAVYRGDLPNGVKLGRIRDGQREHYPGWDLTFAAPKSVSIMAEVMGDRRLIDAHDKAVETALAWIEANYAATRIRRNNKIDLVHTANLTTAVYRHDVSRAGQPHLHSHAIVMNATQDHEGQWRSVEGRTLWNAEAMKQGGLIYQQVLARDSAEFGYKIIPHSNGTFDIDGFPQVVTNHFSKRSRDIEAYLAAQGLDRENSTVEQRNLAMQRTRPDKPPAIEPEQQRKRWREEITALNISLDELDQTKQKAKERASQPDYVNNIREEGVAEAKQAIDDAAKSLTERDAIFADRSLKETATVFSLGKASFDDIERATEAKARAGGLIFREAKAYEPATQTFEPTTGWTTPQAKRTETDMLAIERRGRNTVSPIYDSAGAKGRIREAAMASEQAGYGWNAKQRQVAEGLLTSPHRITAIQGSAGTAKTTTVLATYIGAMKAKGYDVRVMAQTNVAADVLGLVAGQEGRTVASHLIKERRESGREAETKAPQAWVVDEMSLLSAGETRNLLRAAERADARVVAVGDVMQLGSVNAGRAFSQLQDQGMETLVLEQIVRQQNPELKKAVEHGAKGSSSQMLDHIERGGGQIIRVGEQAAGADLSAEWFDRIGRMVDDYMTMAPEKRERTLLIDPSREGRDLINEQVRLRKQARNELRNTGIDGVAHILVSKDLTTIEKTKALSYEPGDVVRFQRGYGANSNPSVQKDEELVVTAVDQEAGKVTLRNARDQDVIWRPDKWSKVESYQSKPRELAIGETVTFTRTDKDLGVRNGQTAKLVNFQPETQIAQLTIDNRAPLAVDLKVHRHWDYGYARTVHLAQSKTADRAFIHAESYRANVVNARSAYTAVSRARLHTRLYTDDPTKLREALTQRSGAKAASLDLSAINAGRTTVTAAQRAPTPTPTSVRAPTATPTSAPQPNLPVMGR